MGMGESGMVGKNWIFIKNLRAAHIIMNGSCFVIIKHHRDNNPSFSFSF